jgi:hypothetical protein
LFRSVLTTVFLIFVFGSVTTYAQPSFQFCGLTYNERDGNSGLFAQIKELPQCRPGKGSIWRVRFDPETSDPSHIAAIVCDFSKQIIINRALGKSTVTCVVRGKPAITY